LLRLRKVELFGFKSFSQRTTLSFNGCSITAVVGPNGCGKSNIADAILWVLGEQSPRTLRSGRMADCIFNGTTSQPPTNLAEVTLTLVDPQAGPIQQLHPSPETPADDEAQGQSEQKRKKNRLNLKILPGEVVVTRRLYRSGESEYYMDGEPCRLRDIQEFFMGTGLGPESYAIIEQGRIGQILSSRPADRRAIIEEAAGVTKYKTRRRLAQAKLESAQQNLLRVTDILQEVTKQLNSLKRQAARARRYQQLKAEIQQLRRRLLASQFAQLQAAECTLIDQLEANRVELERWNAQLRALEQDQQRNQARSYELEAALRQQQNQAGQLLLELERAQSRLAEARRQRQDLARQLAEVSQQREVLAAQAAQAAAACATNTAMLRQLTAELETLRANVSTLSAEQESLRGQIVVLEELLEKLQQQRAVCQNELAVARAEAAQLEQLASTVVAQIPQLTTQHEQAVRQQTRIAEEQARLATAIAAAQSELTRAQEEVHACKQRVVESQQKYAAEKRHQEELQQSLAAIAAQQQALADLLAQRAAFAAPVQKLLRPDSNLSRQDFRAVGVVADFAEFDPEYATLLEEYLHDELEYVVVETYEAARTGVALLREQLTGRATFLVDSIECHPAAGSSSKLYEAEVEALRAGNGVMAPLTDLVRFNGPLGVEVAGALPRLSRTYLVRSADIAQEMARKYPHHYFLATDGTCYQGRLVTGGTRNGNGPVHLKSELENVARKSAELTPRVASVESSLHTLEETLHLWQQQLDASQQQLIAQEKNVFQHEQHLQSLASERARWEHEERRLAGEREARISQHREAGCRLMELRQRQQELTVQANELEALLVRTTQQLHSSRQQADRLASQFAQEAVRLASCEERHAASQQEQQRLAAAQEHLTEEQSKLGELQVRLQGEYEQSARVIACAEAEVQQCTEARRVTEEICQAQEAELGALRQSLLAGEAKLRSHRAELETIREQRHALEVQQARLQTERSHVEFSCQSEFGLTGTQLLADCPEPLSGESLAAAEAQYQTLKQKLESLGPINMMALEEFQACEQRYQFLTKQRDDLLASIADTTQVINEIEEVSRKLFEEAFAAINQNFAETFRTLFGGGSAAMRLTEADSTGESGIDLICQPPGKRLQNILLLSGGEKALAALALLIAIFRYQPSPFCILDEVDAPLDDANIARFCTMIQELSTQTQFIIITHNKKTMEIAPVLYGVTMQNAISQIVSVRFDDPVCNTA